MNNYPDTQMAITLRPDQNEVYLSTLHHLDTDGYAIITDHPGSGKTLILSFILLKYPNALIMAPSNFELCYVEDKVTKNPDLNTEHIQFKTVKQCTNLMISQVSLCVWYNIHRKKPLFSQGAKHLCITEPY